MSKNSEIVSLKKLSLPFFFFFMCTNVWSALMSVQHMHIVLRGQRKVSDLVELEFTDDCQTTLCGSWDLNRVLWESNH